MRNNHFGLKHLGSILCVTLLLTSCRSAGKRPDNTVHGSQASYILTATGLLQAYSSNLATADAKYRDKVIYLTGPVDEVESDLIGGYSVNLRAGAEWYDIVSCKFSTGQRDHLVKLSRGNYVRIKGRCSGKIPTLTLSECVLVDEKGAPLDE